MFKTKFIELKTKRYLRKNATKRLTTDYGEANNIGIIFSSEDLLKHKAVKSFVKKLTLEGKNVTVISFVGKGKQNHEFLYDIITPGDISFWGSINDETAQKFVNESFDYLFNLDLDSNQVIENILAKSKAKCRVGIYNEEKSSFYELMINPGKEGSISNLIEDIHHYARKLTVNEN